MRESALVVLLAWTLAAHHGLCGKLEKIAQQQSNYLVDYYAYRHISIIHFDVPERTVAVVFKYVSVRKRMVGSPSLLYVVHAIREYIMALFSYYFSINVIYLR